MTGDDKSGDVPPTGVVIRAANGDVIRYDTTGLVMRLSDRVVADIATRLGPSEEVTYHAATAAPLDAEILGDIDAWNLSSDGHHYRFTADLKGGHGPRDFRKPLDGAPGVHDVFADAPGPLFGLLSLGGARRAWAIPGAAAFPFHVLAPGDDIGAVGAAGIEELEPTDGLLHLPERSRDALIADAMLTGRRTSHKALPLIMVRAETDASACVRDLAHGLAFHNLMIAATTLKSAAARLGKRPRLLAIGLDYALEDIKSNETEFRDGMLHLMDKLTDGLADLGYRKPLFIASFACGTRTLSDHPVLRAGWELAWGAGDHDLVFSAPDYMFAQDDTGRPTANSLQEQAEMDALAIVAKQADEEWFCPVFLLAEKDSAGHVLRITGRAMSDLLIDPGDPLSAGPHAGFRLSGVTNGAEILDVTRAPDHPQDILITCSAEPEGRVEVLYGFGAPDSPDDYPAMRGAVRDQWQSTSKTGRILHRWALPCALPLN